jgi:hypothetical protein
MNPETQALIATLAMFIDSDKSRRRFDTPEQAKEDGGYNWSPEMRLAMQQLEDLQSGKLIVTRKEPE